MEVVDTGTVYGTAYITVDILSQVESSGDFGRSCNPEIADSESKTRLEQNFPAAGCCVQPK
jgi:hypothetical protein